MGKLTFDEANKWAKENNLNDNWLKNKLKIEKNKNNIKTAKDDWANSIFLLRSVTDYINLYFEQALELTGQDLLFSITDQTANNVLKNTTNKQEDKGIDSIILIGEDGQLINSPETLYKNIKNIIIFQAKNSSTPNGFEKEFKNAPNNLRDLLNALINDPQEYQNSLAGNFIYSVVGSAIRVKLENAVVTYVYVTACDASENSNNNAPDWINRISGFPLNIKMAPMKKESIKNEVLVTLDRLKSLIEEKKKLTRKKAVEPSVGDKTLDIASFRYEQFYSSKASAYQGMVYLKDYAKFLVKDKESFNEELINDNVRGKQGNGRAANKAIRNLLSKKNSNPEGFENYVDFWWLNNGITIIAKKVVQLSPRAIKLTNPQIVNGQQTSRQIFSLKDNNFNPEWKIKINFIIIPNNNEISNEIRSRIIIGVNTQTPVTISNTLGLDNRVRKLSGYIADESQKKVLLSVKSEKQLENKIRYPYEVIIQMIVAGFYKNPGEARRGISTLVKNYFDVIFTENNTENNTSTIKTWIRLIREFDKYNSLYKESNWCDKYGIEKNFDLGDNYGYLGMFTFINKNVNPIENIDNQNLLCIEKLSNYEITEEKFCTALKEWHEFMNTDEHKKDPDGYTKSSKFSAEIKDYINDNQ